MTRYVSKIRWVSQNASRMGDNNLMHDWRGRIEDVIHDVYTTGYTRGKASVGTDCEERPHGEWIFHDTYTVCGNCGKHFPYKNHKKNFCDECGADMRDKKDDLIEIIEAVQSIKEGDANEVD